MASGQANEDEPERMEGGEPLELDAYRPVLERTVRVVTALGVPHAFMGGLASTVYGRDRMTHDIDLLVRRDDAGRVLDALAADGFATERRDESWLYKATLDGVLVDVIFEAGANRATVELDDEMAARTRQAIVAEVPLTVLGPEDLLVIKVLAHKERRSRHWFDAIALLAGADGLDWDYLVARAAADPDRVASLLLYARAEGVAVPDAALAALIGPGRDQDRPGQVPSYELHRVSDALAGDPATAELEVLVEVSEGVLVLTGVVASEARRQALSAVAGRASGGRPVRNLTTVAEAAGPPNVERLA